MPKTGNISVFISYARKDGQDLAQRLKRGLEAEGFGVWLDTERMGGGATWSDEIERAIDQSEIVLALLTRGSFVSDICRAEQLRALRKGKAVIPILVHAGADVPLHLQAKHYRDFSKNKSYAAQFRLLITEIRAGNKGIPLRKEFRTTYVTVPPLPCNYIALPHALLRLRDAVIRTDPGPSISLTALRGMGGVGKTVLAQALSQDQVVQEALPDGIVSANGTLAFSVSDDRTLRMWNLQTGETLILSCDVPLRCCAYQERGYIVAGDQSGNIHFIVLEQ